MSKRDDRRIDRCNSVTILKHPVSRDLHAYWDGLRGDRTAPERRDIDPAAIRHILAYTFVLDAAGPSPVSARDLRFRLAGTRIGALFGEPRGRTFDRIWDLDALAAVDAMLGTVLDERTAVVASTRCGPSPERAVDLELLLLPLRHHGQTHTRILGSLAGAVVPDWMGLVPAGSLALSGFRSLLDRADERMPTGAARPPAYRPLSAGHAVPALRSGRFTVYDGGRSPSAVPAPPSA